MLCKAINKAGKPCKAQAMSNGYCYRHNPEIADTLKLEASKKGGHKDKCQAKTAQPIDTKSLTGLLTALETNANDLRQGNISPRVSNALVQNVMAILEVKKVIDLDQRLSRLERQFKEVGCN